MDLVTASDLINKALWKMDIQDPAENYMIQKIPTSWEGTPLKCGLRNNEILQTQSSSWIE